MAKNRIRTSGIAVSTLTVEKFNGSVHTFMALPQFERCYLMFYV